MLASLAVASLLLACAPVGPPAIGEKAAPPPAPTGSVLEVTDQMALVCALHKGRVACFGDYFFQLVMPPLGAQLGEARRIDIRSPVVALAAGAYHVCALTVEGNVYCFGWNNAGQLVRRWSEDLTVVPVRIRLDEPVVALSAETSRTCALHAGSGRISCWGEAEPHLQRDLGRGIRAPYVMSTQDGAPLVGVHRLVGMIAQRGDTAFSLRDRWCSLFPHHSSGVARLIARARDDLVAATADCARCVVGAAGVVTCEAENADTSESISLPVAPVELRCQGGECCARGDPAGIACWGVNRTNASPTVILDAPVATFDLGLDIVCFARSSPREGPCHRVSCFRAPWFVANSTQVLDPEWPALDPLLFGDALAELPLCVDLRGPTDA